MGGPTKQQPQHGKEFASGSVPHMGPGKRRNGIYVSFIYVACVVPYRTFKLISCSYFFKMAYSTGITLIKRCLGGTRAEGDPLLSS